MGRRTGKSAVASVAFIGVPMVFVVWMIKVVRVVLCEMLNLFVMKHEECMKYAYHFIASILRKTPL